MNYLKPLSLEDLEDPDIRENFKRLQDYLKAEPVLKGQFNFFEIKVDSAVTLQKFAHNLGFAPQDVIQTSIIGTGQLTWNYENFDRNYIVFTTTGPCKVRVFVGNYQQGFII